MTSTTLLDLPPRDILFTYIFSYLEVHDIWVLRLVCHEMHSLCWDYFCNVCVHLSVSLAMEYLPPPPHSMVGLNAGIAIFRKSKRIQSAAISGLGGRKAKSGTLQELLRALVDADGLLKRLCLSRVDLSGMVPLLEELALKCRELKELELCCVGRMAVQWTLVKLLQHSTRTLQRLHLKELIFTPSQPLPVELLSNLKHISITDCGSISSEGCLEELFRKCPLLEAVELHNVQTVTNRTLLVLTEYCSRLRRVVVNGCPMVTVGAIDRLQSNGVGVYTNIDRTLLRDVSMLIPGQI